jgi:parvulin-like peptidyl-prolyl isomerase
MPIWLPYVLLHRQVSVTLLKDEKEASRRLSEFAEKEIDRHAVARKRSTISKKLVPWLLRRFSQDATKPRLKIIVSNPPRVADL